MKKLFQLSFLFITATLLFTACSNKTESTEANKSPDTGAKPCPIEYEEREAARCTTDVSNKQWGIDVLVKDRSGGSPLSNIPVMLICGTYDTTVVTNASGIAMFGEPGGANCPCVTPPLSNDQRKFVATFPSNTCSNTNPKVVVVTGVVCTNNYNINCR